MPARLALPSAALGMGAIVLLTLLGAAAFPGYSHMSQFISELGARGAPNEMLIRFMGFLPAGVFLCTFVVVAFLALPRSGLTTFGLFGLAVYASGYLIASFFPCDAGCRPLQPSASQVIHNLAGLAGYLFAPLLLLALGWSARRWPDAKHLAALGFVAAMLSLIGLLTLTPSSPYVGLSQRVIEGSVLLWVLACGAYIRSAVANAT